MTDTAKDIVAWLRRAALNQKRYTEPMENKAATLIEQQAKRIAQLEAALSSCYCHTGQHLAEVLDLPAPSEQENKSNCSGNTKVTSAPSERQSVPPSIYKGQTNGTSAYKPKRTEQQINSLFGLAKKMVDGTK
jgi:hypothetical protein